MTEVHNLKKTPDIEAAVTSSLSNVISEENIVKDFKKEQTVILKNKRESDRDLIKNVNNKVLVDILSPEIRDNEKKKRIHKTILIAFLIAFLVMQLYFVYCLSSNVITYATTVEAQPKIVNALLTFVSGYITSVIVELIAILNYIVKNVFDTSIIELVKLFKDTPDTKESN